MKAGIYGRQSKEKKDSLSITVQHNAGIKMCNDKSWEYSLYADKGKSGKSMKRPDFQRLIRDIKAGVINIVIVYKMDRVSRSLLDFADLLNLFKEYDVQFISVTEQFDTSSPIGRAMVYIIMIFAQLERETICERVRDSWYARATRGIFPGGHIPYGYISERRMTNGKKQSILAANPETCDNVPLIYNLYVIKNLSLRAVAKELNDMNVPPPRHKYKGGVSEYWTSSAVKIILGNVIYCPATLAIYRIYDKLGCNIISDVGQFDGKYGAFLGGTRLTKNLNTVISPYSERFLIVGNHPPLVDAEIWLAARQRLESNENSVSNGHSQQTWLSGFLKCAECGYAYETTSNKIHMIYLKCSGRARRGRDACANNRYYKASELEDFIGQRICEHIKNLSIDYIDESPAHQSLEQDMKLIEIEKKIKNLVDAIENGAPSAPLNRRIEELEDERRRLVDEAPAPKPFNVPAIKNLLSVSSDVWAAATLDERRSIAKLLVSRITVDNDFNINIEYEI